MKNRRNVLIYTETNSTDSSTDMCKPNKFSGHHTKIITSDTGKPHTQTQTRARAHTHTHTHTHTRALARMHAHTHTNAHTYLYKIMLISPLK